MFCAHFFCMLQIVGPCSETASRGYFLSLAAHWQQLLRTRCSLHKHSFLGCGKLSAINDLASIYLFWMSAPLIFNDIYQKKLKSTRALRCLTPLPPKHLKRSLNFNSGIPFTLPEKSLFCFKADTCPASARSIPVWLRRGARSNLLCAKSCLSPFSEELERAPCCAAHAAGRCEGKAGLIRPTFLANFKQLP